ncbi:MAG: type II secretion system minor pseudopilin GspJ [Pseudomonadota bacterium]
MASQSDPAAGFSLIETLVALFVIALISTAAGSMLLDTLRASDRVDASADAIRDLEVATGLMRSDFGAMTRRPSTAPDSYLPPAGPIGNDGSREGIVLAFVRGGWADYSSEESLRSDLMRVEYHRVGDTLVRRAYGAPDPTVRTQMVEKVLLNQVNDLSVRYYVGGAWSEVWETAPREIAPVLPDLIEVDVTLEDGRRLSQKLIAGGIAR